MPKGPSHTWLATCRRPPCDHYFEWSQRDCKRIARRSPTGRRQVTDVAGRSQVRFGRKEVLLAASETSLRSNRLAERFLLIARRSGTGPQLVDDWSPTNHSGCRQSQHSFHSPTGLQTVVDLSAIINIRSRNSRQPIANRLPIGPQLTGWQPLSDHMIV